MLLGQEDLVVVRVSCNIAPSYFRWSRQVCGPLVRAGSEAGTFVIQGRYIWPVPWEGHPLYNARVTAEADTGVTTQAGRKLWISQS